MTDENSDSKLTQGGLNPKSGRPRKALDEGDQRPRLTWPWSKAIPQQLLIDYCPLFRLSRWPAHFVVSLRMDQIRLTTREGGDLARSAGQFRDVICASCPHNGEACSATSSQRRKSRIAMGRLLDRWRKHEDQAS